MINEKDRCKVLGELFSKISEFNLNNNLVIFFYGQKTIICKNNFIELHEHSKCECIDYNHIEEFCVYEDHIHIAMKIEYFKLYGFGHVKFLKGE